MKIILLHPATVTPEAFAKLVGPVPGFELVFPRAANGTRWSHLGDEDVPALLELGGDFVCGYSAGAMMALRMTHERAYRAAAVVCGALLRPQAASWAHPCPVLLVSGTADSRVLYAGKPGPYGYLGAQESAQALAKLLGVTTGPIRTSIPNTHPADGCRAYVDDWGKVRLYTCVNGNHTWPGSKLNPPALGKVCMDFSATTEIARFFSTLS